MTAIRFAHSYHMPLQLSPDHFWTLIIDGFQQHMTVNAETLKKAGEKQPEFKKKLVVRRDAFEKYSAQNDWAGVFTEWSDQIKDNIG